MYNLYNESNKKRGPMPMDSNKKGAPNPDLPDSKYVVVRGKDGRREIIKEYYATPNGKVYKTSTHNELKTNHHIVSLYTYKGKMNVRLNHLFAETFIPNPNKHRYIIPKDGDVSNFAASNLVWSPIYYKSHHCLVFFDITGMPHMFMSYQDFAKKTGWSCNGLISKLIKGEIDNLGEWYSAAYIERMMDEHFTEKEMKSIVKHSKNKIL